MAAQDYFASFGGQPRPPTSNPYPPQYRPSPPPVQVSTPDFRPTHLPYNGTMAPYNPPQQQQPHRPRPPYPDEHHSQYGLTPPDPSPFLNQPPPQNQSSNYLMAPLAPQRSYSEPPDNRMPSLADMRHEPDRRQHRHGRSRDRSSSSSRSRSRSRSRDRSQSRSRSRRDRGRGVDKARRDRDTFLGAGGGSILGDLIFPGAGTLGGMILGGLGGHEYARRRSKSEIPDRERPHHHRKKSDHRSEWDRKNGITVHSGWIDR